MKRAAPIVVEVCVVVLAISLWSVTTVGMAEEAATAADEDEVVAFYFHGDFRCTTCRTIEAYAAEAVNGGFADQIASGSLEWRVVNVERPENKHFIEDFQLVTRSVVLAEYHDGKVVRWQNLDKVWQLVRDKDRFVSYVQNELGGFLGEG